MKNILTLTQFTLREAFSKKIFITFLGVSSFILLMFVILFLTVSLDDLTGAIQLNGTGIADPLEEILKFFRMTIIMPLYGLGLFLSIFSTSSFIPNMLEKGSVDLLLSKPVSRSQIIWGKFLGGSLVVFINIAYLVIGIWILLGLKFGNWDPNILTTIGVITFTFAVLYSLIILIGVITRSSLLAMMLTYLIFFVLSPILSNREQIILLIDNKFVEAILDGLYYILPKTNELGQITANLASGAAIGEYQPIVTSLLFLILSLTLSIIIFSKKDY
ncbi:ABC transporter permease [Bacteroidota bacterium]